MRRFLLLAIFASLSFVSFAQSSNDGIKEANQLIRSHQKELKLTTEEANQLIVYNSYIDNVSGARLIYAYQGFQGIPVFQQIKVMAFKNGKLYSDKGDKVQNINSLNASSNKPTISSLQAANLVLLDRKANINKALTQIEASANGQEFKFDATGVCYDNLTAKLFWFADGKDLKLAWNVFVSPINNTDYWQVQIDAHSGKILNAISLTDHCSFEAHPNGLLEENHQLEEKKDAQSFVASLLPTSPAAIGTSSYRVVPYPAEAPSFPGGAHTLVTDPWNMAPGNATTLKWNSNGTTDYNNTRGNNVWAKQDVAGNNSNTGPQVISTTPLPDLTFDFTPDYTVTPTQTTPVQNQQFNVTNLFYWNNVTHDVLYLYGLDEPAANFQANNLGRGGNQNDFVYADAQDGSGTNNANFSTPADGGNGRMQMYLWSGNPQKDGDVDNGIITHEYGHGVSNRFTGGGTAGCLTSAEQMGEGWSDYNALMLTQNWATTNVTTGYTVNRGIGTYAIGQSPTGLGIRSQRYGSNNTKQYLSSIPSAQHDRGEIWAATLWDMTWRLIAQTGQISNSIYDLSNPNAGNVIAFKLVNIGMKLQKCNPGFLDGRDGILAADQLLYGGAYRCTIMQAFAARGMGFDAKQGSASSVTDQTPGFSLVEVDLSISQNVSQQNEGQNVTYTHTVYAGACAAVSNYIIRDTLPSNVTWVSGGNYDAVNRVVSFTINQAAATTQTYSYTVSINTGAYFAPITYFSDDVPSANIPSNYTTTSLNSVNWTAVSTASNSSPNAYFCQNQAVASDMKLALNVPIALGPNTSEFSFYHKFSTEDGWDGGMVEISTNGGATWSDLGSKMTVFPYNGSLGSGSSNPLANRAAFTGDQLTFAKTVINLAPYVNQSILFRFRFGSDNNTPVQGWWVDDIWIGATAKVYIKSNLFNPSNAIVDTAQIETIILPPVTTCTNLAMTTQPTATTVCSGQTATFTAAVSGTAPNYQWQVSTTGCGGTFTNINGATAATLNLTNVTTAMNGYAYKVVVTNTCPSTVTSNCVVLTVNAAPNITTEPIAQTVCQGATATYSAVATGSGTLTYQWQQSTTGCGGTFTDIAGATSATYTTPATTSAMNGYAYRLIVSNACSVKDTSVCVLLNVSSLVAITTQPSNVTTCPATNATFTVATSGAGATYQWQVSTTGCGGTFTNIAGATSASYTATAVTTAMTGYAYRVLVANTCTPTITSSCVVLTVNSTIQINTQPTDQAGCAGTNVTYSVAASGSSLSYQWQVSTDNGSTWNNVSGATTNTLTLTSITDVMNGNKYRVVITNICNTAGTNSNVANLTVYKLPAITTQPVSVAKCVGNPVSFSFGATGTGITYQWQLSTNGGTSWTNIAGETSTTLSIASITQAMNGNQYRAVVTSTNCGSVTTSVATLTVSAAPVATVVASGGITPNSPVTLSINIAPANPNGVYTYEWHYGNNPAVIGTNSTLIVRNIDSIDNEYWVKVYDSNIGCETNSNRVSITTKESPNLYIYPTPNNGLFSVRYYTATTNIKRSIAVFDSKGARVFVKEYPAISSNYFNMAVDIRNKRAGIYHVIVYDKDGKIIASGHVVRN